MPRFVRGIEIDSFIFRELCRVSLRNEPDADQDTKDTFVLNFIFKYSLVNKYSNVQ